MEKKSTELIEFEQHIINDFINTLTDYSLKVKYRKNEFNVIIASVEFATENEYCPVSMLHNHKHNDMILKQINERLNNIR